MLKVVKKSGVIEEYDPKKVYNTIIRAGGSVEIAKQITEEVSKKAYDGIHTSEILKIIKSSLRKMHIGLNARYDLKNALYRLGPTGFPFENFISALINFQGYTTKIRQFIKGRCVVHEIDVIGELNTGGDVKRIMIEAKFRNEDEGYVGLKEAMYTYARFLDISEGSLRGLCDRFDEAWLVCNGKASDEAVQYSSCRGVKLITWNYPPNESLRDMIHKFNAYPITVLTTLSRDLLSRLIDSNIILVKDLKQFKVEDFSKRFKIKKSSAAKIMQEVDATLSF
ncbi:MAG: ATP cone domain-containing protein [Candidatus Odinarchaeum yellowstonii]|uniref:ATP cone domain-containing protein n=1 Tax=Odinarchaeota yellowstonii (strain LCB_4) TaxID=1841599 RepID=A0AAF0ICT0_ODILC|nr:MAG: ATP cone domain-containing protein [Candidatus Odinarchaeum yellowstonii]